VVLASLREQARSTMTETAYVLRASKVSDGAGGRVLTRSIAAQTICRVGHTGTGRADVNVVAEQLKGRVPYILTFPEDAGQVYPQDRVVVLSGNQQMPLPLLLGAATRARTFLVIAPVGPRSFEVARRVICVEVQ
jgi:hypothetical protein